MISYTSRSSDAPWSIIRIVVRKHTSRDRKNKHLNLVIEKAVRDSRGSTSPGFPDYIVIESFKNKGEKSWHLLTATAVHGKEKAEVIAKTWASVLRFDISKSLKENYVIRRS